MALLTITECDQVAFTLLHGQVIAAPQMPGVNEQNVAIGAGSLLSLPWTKDTRYVLINADTACCLAWSNPLDPDPVAVNGIQQMGQNETRFIGVTPGGKLAVIEKT